MKHNPHIILLLVSLLAAHASEAQEIVVPQHDTAMLSSVVSSVSRHQSMKHASLSVCVYNITQSVPVYDYDSYRSLTPASVNKIFPIAVGFDQLTSKFRFKTSLLYSGDVDREGVLHGNVYIVGGGDPMLGSYRYRQTQPDSLFAAWLKVIKGMGIRAIDGRICYDASIFDNQPLCDSWQWGDVGNYYGSGAYGLNYHENMYFTYFNPGKKLGYPATGAGTKPKNVGVRNQNEVITGGENSGDQVTVFGDPYTMLRSFRGSVPLGKNNFAVRASLPNPPDVCARMFSVYLRNNGINVSHNVSEVFGRQDSCKVMLEYESENFYVVAQYANLTSNNIYVESIFKYLGYKRYGKGSFANGSRAVGDFFRIHNLESSGVKIVDGCGLSRRNMVTTDFICRFLAELARMPIYNDFSKSMAKAGENGTVRNLLPGLPSNVTVRIKSGTMEGVKAYAGYVTTRSGDLLCFSVISNGHTCNSTEATRMLEKILYQVAKL